MWPSFIEIGEMACITTAWSSHGHALNSFCSEYEYMRHLFELRATDKIEENPSQLFMQLNQLHKIQA